MWQAGLGGRGRGVRFARSRKAIRDAKTANDGPGVFFTKPLGLFLFRGFLFFALFRILGSSVLARRFFLFVPGFFCFRGGLVRFVALAGTGLFSALVRHVPTPAFELNRRRGGHRFDFAAAVRAFFQ